MFTGLSLKEPGLSMFLTKFSNSLILMLGLKEIKWNKKIQ